MELRKDEQITLNIDGFIISQNIHNTNTAQSLFGIKNKNNLNIGHDDRTWVLEQDIICDTCNRCVSCQTCNSCNGCVSTVGCNSSCQGCTGSCTGCASGCYESCFGDCYSCQDCQAGCTACNNCTANCDSGCQTECYSCVSCDDCVGCNNECVGCFDNCQETCQTCTTCASCNAASCVGFVTSCQKCTTECQTACTNGCTGSCNSGCQGICQGPCVECQTGCQTGCNSKCQTSCVVCVDCQTCYGTCTSCASCTTGCQGGCQAGCQVGCTGCTGCTSPCTSCTTCNGSACSTTTGCLGACTQCTTGCFGGGCQGSCQSDENQPEEDVISPDCWNTDSGGFGRNPPTNTGSTEGNYNGEKNGPAPKTWLNSGKTQEQWDALSHQGVEDYAKEHNIPIKPTDPKGNGDKPFIGVEVSSVNQALGINGEGQPKVKYKIDYKYNPETGLNEGYAVAEDGTVLSRITNIPGSDEFIIENLNNSDNVKSSISTVKVNQDTGKSTDLKTETENKDGSKVISTEKETIYIGPDKKEVNTDPTGGGC